MMAAHRNFKDVVGIVVPTGCLIVSSMVVVGFVLGESVPRTQLAAAAFVAVLSLGALLAEVL